MALRNILTEENPALRKVCRPYTAFDERLHQLLDDMKGRFRRRTVSASPRRRSALSAAPAL